MTAKNFVNYHVLISHSPSCLNRDDMNMQKTAIFGGVRRVRISSQSLKRAIRKSDYYKKHFDTSVRTRRLFDMAVSDLLENESSAKTKKAIEQAGLFAAAIFEGKTKPDDIKKYKRADNGHIETQVIPFHASEIDSVKRIIAEAASKKESERLEFMRDAIAKIQKEQATQVSLDVGLSGRMANSDLLYGVDGALAVAHALTTHEVDGDIDWFTAVDDLTQDRGETGAGHLNTQEFSAGVFYRYASLNLRQLQVNLGLLSDMKAKETTDSRKQALEIAAHVLHLLATVVPSAKQQAFAAHNLADFAMVTFSDQPVSLANAFESPVRRGSGLLAPSIECLCDYWEKVHNAYGLEENAASFSVTNQCKTNDVKSYENLEKLKQWIRAGGE